MLYKSFGNTGKKVSKIGFGGMRFDTNVDLEKNAELVHYAHRKGITYFDTAPGYCKDQSEDIFGLAFQNISGDYVVSSKAMPAKQNTADKARAAVEQSLSRLGINKIDFYYIWCLRKMEHYHMAMRPGGQYEGLRKCQEEGLIGHIVFSSHQPGDQIAAILDEGFMDGVLLGMNILNYPYRWEGVKKAWETGYGVAAMNPLAGGMIPENEDKLAFLSMRGNESPTQAALRFAMSCPYLDTALVGFTTKEQVDAACSVAEYCQPFSDSDLASIRNHLSVNMNEICTACGYCKGCPRNIPVAAYMQFYNKKQMFGATDEEMKKELPGQHEWGLLAARVAEAGDCVECGLCEELCTQNINIIDRLKEIARWEQEVSAAH